MTDTPLHEAGEEMQASTTTLVPSNASPSPPPPSSPPSSPAGDLTGKTAIVTGANCGIGLECARQLLSLGISKLILAVRNESKGASALADLRNTTTSHRTLDPNNDNNDNNNRIEVWHVDYASYESITCFAQRCESELGTIDIVILNAGVYRIPHVVVPGTGHEEDIQVNYLSTALLALLLLPLLPTARPQQGGSSGGRGGRGGSAPGRIVVVSSSVAAWSRFRLPQDSNNSDSGGDGGASLLASLDSPPAGKSFDHHQQYCTSKLLGQLFLRELTFRIPASAAIITYVNPGLCYGSELTRDGAGTFLGFIVGIIFRVFGGSCVRGAKAVVDAAVRGDGNGKEIHGRYLDGGKVARFAPIVYTPEGRQMAEKLWKETMSELSFAGVEDVVQTLGHC
ncbi:NAD(P)-binding protein [Nemania sp. FL0916]|nr:NAD(P)-binding protein [Nemania sp. FL0916]